MLGRLDADSAVGLPFAEIKIALKVTVSLTYVLDDTYRAHKAALCYG